MDHTITASTDWPKIRSEMHLSAGLTIRMIHPMPCLWWRIWQYLFFGFTWSEVKDEA